MQNKNKKIALIVLAALVIIAIISLIGLRVFYPEEKYIAELKDVKTASDLDEFVNGRPELLKSDYAEPLGLERVQVNPPVPVKLPELKITLIPQMMVGGDAIYEPVANFNGNQYFILNPENYQSAFSVNSPEDALKYVEFITVTMGKSSYERAKKIVYESKNYDEFGCKVMPGEQNNPLPDSRPVSLAKRVDDKYEVSLVYFTPVYPAGYYTSNYLVEKDGNITLTEKAGKPFWSCGGGIVF